MQEESQGKLEDLLLPDKEPRKARRIDIDPKRIEEELKEYAGNTPFKLHIKPHSERRVSIRETDKCMDITINPRRIRTQEQLDEVMQSCQNSFCWG